MGTTRGVPHLAKTMLSLVRSRAGLLAARNVRPLCAAAELSDEGKIIKKLEDAIAMAKESIEKPADGSQIYSKAQFTADEANGTLDLGKIGEIFKDDPEFKQEMITLARNSNELTREVKALALKATPTPSGDMGPLEEIEGSEMLKFFSSYAKSADFRAKEEARLQKEVDDKIAAAQAEYSKLIPKLTAELDAIDKAMMEDKVAALKELESMFYEAKNIDNLTVAEMLEANPEWRLAIEEDIKNHNWGPEAPESIVASIKGKAIA